MKKLLLTCACCAFILNVSISQSFLRPFEGISHKKTTYLTMEDGSEKTGTVKKLERKKGLIKEVKIKNEKGKKVVIPIEDIKHAYFPQSGLDALSNVFEVAYDAEQWDKGLYDADRLKDGYAYFEKAEVQVKKKKRILLMQLLNPGTCSRIKIYHDPFANESAGIGVAGIKLAGGDDKSYYISKDGEVAYRLKKKNYKDVFKELFGDCSSVKKKYAKKKWNKFEEAIFEYNKACKE